MKKRNLRVALFSLLTLMALVLSALATGTVEAAGSGTAFGASGVTYQRVNGKLTPQPLRLGVQSTPPTASSTVRAAPARFGQATAGSSAPGAAGLPALKSAPTLLHNFNG